MISSAKKTNAIVTILRHYIMTCVTMCACKSSTKLDETGRSRCKDPLHELIGALKKAHRYPVVPGTGHGGHAVSCLRDHYNVCRKDSVASLSRCFLHQCWNIWNGFAQELHDLAEDCKCKDGCPPGLTCWIKVVKGQKFKVKSSSLGISISRYVHQCLENTEIRLDLGIQKHGPLADLYAII